MRYPVVIRSTTVVHHRRGLGGTGGNVARLIRGQMHRLRLLRMMRRGELHRLQLRCCSIVSFQARTA